MLFIIFYCYYISNIRPFSNYFTKNFYRSFSYEKLNYKELSIFFFYLVLFIFTLFTKLMLNYNERPPIIKVELKRIMTGKSCEARGLKEVLLVDEKKTEKKVKKNANLLEVIIKFILIHTDKITLILMYCVAVNDISIVHFSIF